VSCSPPGVAGIRKRRWRDGRLTTAVLHLATRKTGIAPQAGVFQAGGGIEFYETHFQTVKGEEPLSRELGEKAGELARQFGIAAVDALHLAAAIRQGATEFITAEKPGKPMFRRDRHYREVHSFTAALRLTTHSTLSAFGREHEIAFREPSILWVQMVSLTLPQAR